MLPPFYSFGDLAEAAEATPRRGGAHAGQGLLEPCAALSGDSAALRKLQRKLKQLDSKLSNGQIKLPEPCAVSIDADSAPPTRGAPCECLDLFRSYSSDEILGLFCEVFEVRVCKFAFDAEHQTWAKTFFGDSSARELFLVLELSFFPTKLQSQRRRLKAARRRLKRRSFGLKRSLEVQERLRRLEALRQNHGSRVYFRLCCAPRDEDGCRRPDREPKTTSEFELTDANPNGGPRRKWWGLLPVLLEKKSLREVLLKSLDDCLHGPQHALSCRRLKPANLEEEELCGKTVKFSAFLEAEKNANSQQSSVRFTPENLFPDISRPDWRSEKRFTRVIGLPRRQNQTCTSAKRPKRAERRSGVAEDSLALMKDFAKNSTLNRNDAARSPPKALQACSKNLFRLSEREPPGNRAAHDSRRRDWESRPCAVMNPNVVARGEPLGRQAFSPLMFGYAPAKENDGLALNVNWGQVQAQQMVFFNYWASYPVQRSHLLCSEPAPGKRFGRSKKENLRNLQRPIAESRAKKAPRREATRPRGKWTGSKKPRGPESYVIKKDFSCSTNSRSGKTKGSSGRRQRQKGRRETLLRKAEGPQQQTKPRGYGNRPPNCLTKTAWRRCRGKPKQRL